jgi:hypothetical protein
MLPESVFDASSSLEAAIARDSRRGRQIPKISVKTVDEIRRLLMEFDPSKDRGESVVEVKGDLPGNVDGNTKPIQVSAKSVGKTKRQLLVEAIEKIAEAIKISEMDVEAIEINGKLMKPAKTPAAQIASYIDPMISQWLDAKRDGTIIYWDLQDGYRYKYEPISHKLTRSDRLKTV